MWRWLPLVLAGCYAPEPPLGAPCGPGRLCPNGQTCVSVAEGDRCLASDPGAVDAARDDADPDVCVPRRLLTGGADLVAQGWEVVRSGNGGAILGEGTATRLQTTANASQLIVLRGGLPITTFVVDIALEVLASGGHASGEAAVALMASFHDPRGDDLDRELMVFLDDAKIGFGDASVSIGFDTHRVVHYLLERTADAAIRFSTDNSSIARGPFTTNGTLAIGDQSTVAGLDSTIRISSIDLLCP